MRLRFLSLSHRLLIALALPWAAAGGAAIAVTAGPLSPIHDQMFLFAFFCTATLLAGSFFLWRRFVVWTLGRRVGTAGTTFVLLGHVLLWMPAWNAGCFTADLLRLSQSGAAAGSWIVLTAYIWWGAGELALQGSANLMSPNAKRIIFSFALIPFIPGLWGIVGIAFDQFISSDFHVVVIVAHAVSAFVIVAWWMVVWRACVFASTRSAVATMVAAMAYVILSLGAVELFQFIDGRTNAGWAEGLWITLPLVLTGVWFALTPLLWPRGTAGGAGPVFDVEKVVACGRCGYSLVGLNATRCPECGHEEPLNAFVDRIVMQVRPDV